jgi:hypothetical protein
VTRAVLPLPCSVADHVALARRVVSAPLVSAAAWRSLRRIADPLPPVSEDAALEVRLDGDDPRVDLSLCVRPTDPERSRLAGALSRSEAAMRSRAWRRAAAFLRAWANEASPLHEAVHAIWLEFDAEGPAAPEPFLVFSLDEERLYADGTAMPEALLACVFAGIDELSEAGRSPAGTGLERCLRGLPRYAQLRHVAVRPTPSGHVTRLVVRMPWRRLPETLVALGWPGEQGALHAVLASLCPVTLVHAVNLDVGENGLGPRVGIEFIHAGAPRESARWKALFDELESRGACTPERRAAIDAWGGELPGPRLGPGWLRVRRDLMVKVVHQPGVSLRAKAYLAFGLRLLVPEQRSDRRPAASYLTRADSE